MLQLQNLKNDDIIFLDLIAKDMITELQQVVMSLSTAKSNVANLNDYKSNEQFLLDIVNLDQVKDKRLIVSRISNFQNREKY